MLLELMTYSWTVTNGTCGACGGGIVFNSANTGGG
jgi:hypothetical protein